MRFLHSGPMLYGKAFIDQQPNADRGGYCGGLEGIALPLLRAYAHRAGAGAVREGERMNGETVHNHCGIRAAIS